MTPVIIIGVIYVVAVGVSEWRLRQHVERLREPAPVEVVVEPSGGDVVLVAVDR